MQKPNPWLFRFSLLTVFAAFVLILIGSLVTTNGAGMAFADWPLSSGSLNPDGWWSHFLQRLEHGHRLFAELTGCLVGILCAWVWANRWAFPAALVVSTALSVTAKIAGAPPEIIAHIGLWSAAAIFAGMLLAQARRQEQTRSSLARWLAFAAFCGVVAQAVLGGLRVTLESGGNSGAALAVRIVHGCFAQVEFGLLVLVAATLCPCADEKNGAQISGIKRIRMLAWLTFGFIFLQLILGATIRHTGTGLIIPMFPKTSPTDWLPPAHSPYAHIQFTHTRVIALLVVIHAALLALRVFRSEGVGASLKRPALALLLLVAAQGVLGISVIWSQRWQLPTTLHVVNGALILAASLLLAVRASRLARGAEAAEFSNIAGRVVA